MPEREQIRRERSSEAQVEATAGAAAVGGVTKQGEKLKAELDELLDEIDEVLEVNAEEFVKGYVQKGGE